VREKEIVCASVREKERERERHTHTHKQADRESKRAREAERDTDREKDNKLVCERQSEGKRGREGSEGGGETMQWRLRACSGERLTR